MLPHIKFNNTSFSPAFSFYQVYNVEPQLNHFMHVVPLFIKFPEGKNRYIYYHCYKLSYTLLLSGFTISVKAHLNFWKYYSRIHPLLVWMLMTAMPGPMYQVGLLSSTILNFKCWHFVQDKNNIAVSPFWLQQVETLHWKGSFLGVLGGRQWAPQTARRPHPVAP